MKVFLGVDVGSISTNIVAIDQERKIIAELYIRTEGAPIEAVQKGLAQIKKELPEDAEVAGVGATGSARELIGSITGADIVKNEITAHAVGASHEIPDVQTILEIGGQDSKIIILRDGVVTDFAMNSVCAAGTGSFLDAQASRLKIPIEEFGQRALACQDGVNIAGRCTVFAESDMIHKQQTGHSDEAIIKGLCAAIVRNYLNNVAKGKEILAPIVFQGGVSENIGVKKAFEEELKEKIIIPPHNKVMGAFGAALLAQETPQTKFKGFDISEKNIKARSFTCEDCPNHCEVIEALENGQVLSRWNDRCGKWGQKK